VHIGEGEFGDFTQYTSKNTLRILRECLVASLCYGQKITNESTMEIHENVRIP